MARIRRLEQLRAEVTRLNTAVTTIQGRQDAAQEEVARLEGQLRELGVDPDDYDAEIEALRADAEETLRGVTADREELGRETGAV